MSPRIPLETTHRNTAKTNRLIPIKAERTKPFHRSKSVTETPRAVKGGYLSPVRHKTPLFLDRSTFRHLKEVHLYQGLFFDGYLDLLYLFGNLP